MSLLLDKIRVSHFGGIRGSAVLDLTAPLTVLYAPNGTGKTSFVEGLNWAFEGDCREARCRLSDWDETTEVKFLAHTKNGRSVFSKTVAVDGREERMVGKESAGVSAFLQALAPDCNVEGLNHRTQIARLTAYLSANRVLTVEALAAVIDSSNSEARASAMADMLGTRAQHNAQKQLELYWRRVSDWRRRLEEREKSLVGRQAELAPRIQSLDVDLAVLSADVAKALRLQNTQLPKQSELVPFLRRSAAEEGARLKSDQAAYDELNAMLDVELPDAAVERLSAALAASDATFQGLRTQLDTWSNTQLADSSALNIARNSHKIAAQAVPLARQLESLVQSDPKTPGPTVGDVAGECDENEKKFDGMDQARSLLSVVERGLNQWRADMPRLSEIDALIADIDKQLSNVTGKSELESQLAQLRAELQEENERERGIEDLGAQLTSIAQQLYEHDPAQHHCPACKHDWGSHEQLGVALRSALADVPLVRQTSVNRRATLAARIEEAERSLRSRNSLEARRGAAERERVTVANRVSGMVNAAAKFQGQSPDDFEPASIATIRASLDRSDLVRKLYDLISSDSALKPLWSGVSVTQLADAIVEAARQKQEEISGLERRLEAARREVGLQQQKLANEAPIRSRVDEQLKVARGRVRRLRELEKRFSIGSLTADNVAQVAAGLQRRQVSLSFAETSIGTLERAIQGGQARADMARVRADLTRLKTCMKSIGDEEKRCDSINTSISASIESHREQLVKAIGPSVSELFQRMQVNRVFNAVECSSDLQLSGVLGDAKFDPAVFSAGQKQDLALAFFLVRAHALGGTFFLDEPLAHLDDLNRVALLDTLRGFALSSGSREVRTRLLLTTASWNTARHIMEKFVRIDQGHELPAVRVYRMGGNVTTGTQMQQIYPLPKAMAAAQ